MPLRGTSILRLRRAPSPRGYSYHMQYCTFISQPARYVAYERGKDLSTSLPLTIWSSALHSWHTGRCVEGCLFEAHLSCAFGAPLLQGATHLACRLILPFPCIRISSTYEDDKDLSTSLPLTIRTDVPFRIALSCAVSKGLLGWRVIP